MNQTWEDIMFSVVSFYGFVEKEDSIAAFYEKCVVWFKEFDVLPLHIETGLSKKLGNYKRVTNKIIKDGIPFGQLKRLGISSEAYDSGFPSHGCDLSCLLSPGKECYVRFRSSILSIGQNRLLDISEEIVEMLKPSYGVGFERIGAWGPSYMALGLNFGDVPREEADRVIDFRETTWEKHYLNGYLGGIFPWNFLTAPQLSAKVGKSILEKWIQAAPHRGRLNPLTKEMTLWAVPNEDIPPVYQALREAGVVFNYYAHIDARHKAAKKTSRRRSKRWARS